MKNIELNHFEGYRTYLHGSEPAKYQVRLRFRLSDEFADAIRKISKRSPDDLDKRMKSSVPGNNRIGYGFIKSDMEETIVIVRKILEICNNNTVDYLINHMITNNGIGKVKQLEKTGYDRFEIVNISWDVHWMMNTYLAVIIRDYLRFFIKNTQVIGQCVIDEHKEEYHTANSSFSEEHTKTLDRLFQEWEDLVNSIADEFDELVKINTGDGYDIQTYPEYYEKVEVLSKKAFADLAYIYPDLWW